MPFIGDWLQVIHLAHKDQRRASGRPYEEQPLAVACICRSVSPDDLTGHGVCLAHDGVEDSSIVRGQLSGSWEPEVALMVDGLSKKHLGNFGCRQDFEDEYYGRKNESEGRIRETF